MSSLLDFYDIHNPSHAQFIRSVCYVVKIDYDSLTKKELEIALTEKDGDVCDYICKLVTYIKEND